MFNRNLFPRFLREGDAAPAEKKAGEGGGGGDPKPEVKGVLHEVPAPDGEGTVKLTLPEIRERLAQTKALEERAREVSQGGDRKLRDAAEARKAAQRAQTIVDDLQAANAGDAAAARRLATYEEVQLTPEQAEEYIKGRDKQKEGGDTGGREVEETPEEREAMKERAEEYQAIAKDYRQRGWDRVHGALDKVLDSDPTVGHIMSSADPRIAGVVRRAREEARSALQRRIEKAGRENGKFLPSPQNLQAIAQQEVRDFFLDVGYLEADAVSTGKPAGQSGSGRPVPSLGAGPPAGLPTSFQRHGEAPERPEGGYTNEGGMAGHILEKHKHNMETGAGDNFDNQG